MSEIDLAAYAPEHLSPAARKFWGTVRQEVCLTPHEVLLLTTACETLDRMRQARDVLNREGMTYTDRFGAPRLRPEAAVERDCRLAFGKLLRQLCLPYNKILSAAPWPDEEEEEEEGTE